MTSVLNAKIDCEYLEGFKTGRESWSNHVESKQWQTEEILLRCGFSFRSTTSKSQKLDAFVERVVNYYFFLREVRKSRGIFALFVIIYPSDGTLSWMESVGNSTNDAKRSAKSNKSNWTKLRLTVIITAKDIVT